MADTLITLRPNKNSETVFGGEPYFEMIELSSTTHTTPFAIVHVDLFYCKANDGKESELHKRLVNGETVTVRLVPVKEAKE